MLGAGCTDTITDLPSSRARPVDALEVHITSSGHDIPAEGYRFLVNNRKHVLPATGAARLGLAGAGPVRLHLILPPNCTLRDPVPTSLDPATVSDLRLEVHCDWRETFLFTMTRVGNPYPSIYRHDVSQDSTIGLNEVEAWHGGPRLSPDGGRIVFVSYRRGDSQSSVYIMNRDGSGAHKIADPGGSVGWWAYNLDPTWSPDGSRVAFRTVGIGSAPVRGIVVVNADGSDPQPLGIDGTALDWSPAGDEIVFLAGDALHLLSLASRHVDTIATTDYHELGARLSPDGAYLLAKRVPRTGSGQTELWIIDRAGTNVEQVPTGGEEIGAFSWSADGTMVAWSAAAESLEPYSRIYSATRHSATRQLRLVAPAGHSFGSLDWR